MPLGSFDGMALYSLCTKLHHEFTRLENREVTTLTEQRSMLDDPDEFQADLSKPHYWLGMCRPAARTAATRAGLFPSYLCIAKRLGCRHPSSGANTGRMEQGAAAPNSLHG